MRSEINVDRYFRRAVFNYTVNLSYLPFEIKIVHDRPVKNVNLIKCRQDHEARYANKLFIIPSSRKSIPLLIFSFFCFCAGTVGPSKSKIVQQQSSAQNALDL